MILYTCAQTYHTKARLMHFKYFYILVWIYIKLYLRTITDINPPNTHNTHIHVYFILQSYICLYLRAVNSIPQKQLSRHFFKPTQATYNLPLSYLARTPHLLSHLVVGEMYLVMNGVTGNQNVTRHREKNYYYEAYCCYVARGRPPPKNTYNKKGTLFNLLLMDILNGIDIWMIVL